MPELYVDGAWTSAVAGGRREIRCPADGSLVAEVDEAGAEDTDAAIAAAHQAFHDGDWPTTSGRDRGDLLLRLAPSPVAPLNRAVALRELRGPHAALEAIAPLAEDLATYHLFHAVAADFLADLGRADEARAARQRALDLTSNRADQSLLRRRLAEAA